MNYFIQIIESNFQVFVDYIHISYNLYMIHIHRVDDMLFYFSRDFT